MKASWKSVAALASLLCSPVIGAPTSTPSPSTIPAVVSPSWLEENILDPQLLIVDIRNTSIYDVSHVPGSLSIPFAYDSLWSKFVEDETLVMPPAEEILPALSAQGLTSEKSVVIVTSTATMPNGINQATRVAATLQYVGLAINQVGILDGGFENWVRFGGELSSDPVTPTPASFTGPIDETVVVERPYVHASLNKVDEGVVLIDARPSTAFANGHIESALSVPQIDIWNDDATFKSTEELLALFENGVGDAPVGKDEGEIIVYCFIGLMATGWHFVLTNVLEFGNVKLYDGSVQDWTKEYPLVTS